MGYKQAYNDHCYLWDIASAADMTGGYVDQEDLAKLLKNPTKKQAEECLTDQITYWFQVGPDPYDAPLEFWRDRRVKAIARRYCMEDELSALNSEEK